MSTALVSLYEIMVQGPSSDTTNFGTFFLMVHNVGNAVQQCSSL